MEPSNTEPILAQKERNDVELILKKSWLKRRLNNHSWRIRTGKIKVENEKLNKLFKNISTDNINERTGLFM